MSTRGAAVRVLTGEATYPAPVEGPSVPGPVGAFRTCGGSWIGGSEMYGRRRIVGYTGRIESGPVFAEATVTYRYEDAGSLTITARVVAGQEVVFLSSHSSTHAPDDGWRISLVGAESRMAGKGKSWKPSIDRTAPAPTGSQPSCKVFPNLNAHC